MKQIPQPKRNNKRALFNNKSQVSYLAIFVFACSVLITPALTLAQYAEPGRFPPFYTGTAEIPSLLNGGSLTQQKTGSLILGVPGGTSKLCLNASASGANDPNNCVVSWDDALGKAGNFLRLHQVLNTGANYPADYPFGCSSPGDPECGYIRLKGNAAQNQLYSLYVEAGLNPNNRALFALEHPVSVSYAGYLVGRVKIDNPAHNTFLCLNAIDTDMADGKACIDSWSDVLVPPNSIGLVSLQAGPSYNPQGGKSGVSGTGFMGSMVSGSTAGIDRSLTCGDGICSVDTFSGVLLSAETSGNCQIDCGDGNTPIFSVTPGNFSNRLSITCRSQDSGNFPIQILVVRRPDNAPNFRPQQGSIYNLGSVFTVGPDIEVVNQSYQDTTPCVEKVFQDGGLQNNRTYYYEAWQGNNYPRYAYPGVLRSSTPSSTALFTLTVSTVPAGAGRVTADPAGTGSGAGGGDDIICPSNCFDDYSVGTPVTLTAEDFGVHTFLYWDDACSGDQLDCPLNMTANRNAIAVYGTCDGSGCYDQGGNPTDTPLRLR